MKPILTIDDLKEASPQQVEKALELVTVKNDLFSWLQWLNSPEGAQVESQYKLGHHDRALGIHPSAIAKVGECLLKLHYDVTGAVEPDRKFNMEDQLTWDTGTLIHSMLQTHFANMYEGNFEPEVWLKNRRLLITSHTDGRFKFKKVRFLLEIKSIKEGGNFGFAKVQDRPFPDNVRQLMTYLRLDNCPFGLLFYFCKNNGQIKEHPVVYDSKVWQALKKNTILPVIQSVEEESPPLPKVGYHCRRCPYFKGCPHGKRHQNDARHARRGQPRSAVLSRKRPVRTK
jgi:hypothetical protein